MTSWHRRWQSRRHEVGKGKLDPRPLVKAMISLFVLALVVYGVAWAVVNCWGYTVDHPTRVKDKYHDIDYTERCLAYDDQGRCTRSTLERTDTYYLIMEDGHWEPVYEGKFYSTPVGAEYTWKSYHVACR